jgi:hypothetical protein
MRRAFCNFQLTQYQGGPMPPSLALSQPVVHELCMSEWDSQDPLSPGGEHPVSRRWGKMILAADSPNRNTVATAVSSIARGFNPALD